jgi:hypothetical protein
MKIAVAWDVASRGSRKNRRFGAVCLLNLQDRGNTRASNNFFTPTFFVP